ncbi:MAG: hemoblobin-interacting domain-containing protein [Syntrophomonadaceae bacterium]
MRNIRKLNLSTIVLLTCIMMVFSMPAYTADNTVDVISTVAGNGTQGSSDGEGYAVNAQIQTVYGIAVDSAGNLYFPDSEWQNDRIRKIDTAGRISTVIGAGTDHNFLDTPTAVAVDGAGNLFIADQKNNRIRIIGADGSLSSVDYYGIVYAMAVDSSGNLYLADSKYKIISKIDAVTKSVSIVAGTNKKGGSTGDGGPAVKAKISDSIRGLALDSAGNLYIADSFNQKIRMVDASTQIISTVAGTGTSGFSGDDGPAASAQLSNPQGLAFDGAGNLYIADYNNKRIRKIDAATKIITTFAGNGTYNSTMFDGQASDVAVNYPSGMTFDTTNGKLYFVQGYSIRVVKPETIDPTVPYWSDKTLTVSDLTAASLTLNWNPALDDVGVVGYRVYQGSTLLTPDIITATSFAVTGLTQNTNYAFTVQAVDGDGKPSRFGLNATARTPDATPPTWPSGSLTQSNLVADSITLNWSKAKDNQNKLLGYKIYRDGTLLTPDTISSTTYVVSGLTPATPYTFTVQAVDKSGNESTDGPSLSVTTPAYDVTPPTWTDGSLSYSALGPQSVTLNWSGVAGDNIGVTGYKAKVYQGSDTTNPVEQKTFTGASCTLDLSSGTTYTFKVEAFDANGNESTDGPQVGPITTSLLPLGVAFPVVTGHPMAFEGGMIVDLGTYQFTPGAVTLLVNELQPGSRYGYQIGGKFIDCNFTGGWEPSYVNAMRVTLPLKEGIDPQKCAISSGGYGYWQELSLPSFVGSPEQPHNFSAEDVKKGAELIDVPGGQALRCILAGHWGGGSDHPGELQDYGIWADTEISPSNLEIRSLKPNEVQLALHSTDPSAIKTINFYRDGVLFNECTYLDGFTESGTSRYYYYADRTVTNGQTYRYSAQVVDGEGNVSEMLPEISVSVLTDAETVANIKAMDLLTYADGDSAASVTRNLKSIMNGSVAPYSSSSVAWSATPSGIIDTATGKVTRPADADSVDIKLTATINSGTASDTKDYNLTVRWTETAPVATFTEFATALGRSVVKNIILSKGLTGTGTFDCQNKTVVIDNNITTGDMFTSDSNLAIGNMTVDGNSTSTSGILAANPTRTLICDTIMFERTENINYIINASDYTELVNELVVNNCRFSPAKRYAIFASTANPSFYGKPGYGKKLTLTNNNFPTDADIRIELGSATISNNIINSKFMAYKGATLNGIAITDAASAETAVAALLANNQFTAPTDGSYGIIIYDTDGTTVLYQTLKMAAIAPSLTADSSDNFVSQPVVLTFADDAVWTAAITGITIDGNPVEAGKYTVAANSITIAADAFASAKDYAIVVKAADYTDASVTQTVADIPPAQAPSLTSDTSNNTVGQPVEIIFTDNEDWRVAITGITVDGNPLEAGKYTVAANIITIGADVFTSYKDYAIVVTAAGYTDASITQTIAAPLIPAAPSLTADTTDNTVGQPIEILFIDDPAWRESITTITVDGNPLSGNYTVNAGSVSFAAGVLASAKDYAVVVKATGYTDTGVIQRVTESIPTGSVSLTLTQNKAKVGDSITAYGTAEPNDWVCIRIVDSTPNTIVFDAVKATDNGEYSCTFKVPDVSDAFVTVVAGTGNNIVNKILTITSETVVSPEQHYQIGAPIIKNGDQVVSYLEQGQSYTITVPVTNIVGDDVQTYSAIVLRGGKGARADKGGTVLGSPEVKLEAGKLELTFTVPSNMTGKVYGSVIIWNDAKTFPEAEPLSFTLNIQ